MTTTSVVVSRPLELHAKGSMAQTTVDHEALPSTFQRAWKSNRDPNALPFPKDSPPFNLTSIDWHNLSITDSEFTPHTWTNLQAHISSHQLNELKRWPSALKAYLAWTSHVKQQYGSATNYLLQQRLFWKLVNENETGAFDFSAKTQVPFADPQDYKIMRNDWPYAVTPDIRHIVAWSKTRLPVDDEGVLTSDGRKLVEDFVRREFRVPAGEGSGGVAEGDRVQWFKNSTGLQSVRSLEHVHVLVRNVDEKVLARWMV